MRMRWGVTVVMLLAAAGCVRVVVDEPRPASSAAGDVAGRALKDVERFWTASYPGLADGAAFQPVRGGFHPYTRSDPPPACGGQAGQYQPNAFYCPDGDFIAYDAEVLIPRLQEQFGPLLVGVVVAHEYGHAVQARLGLGEQPTVVLEQQADCFAGAWTADVLAGRSAAFQDVTPAQLDNTVAGLLQLRDQPGTPAQAPEAHGNAFDRVRALQDGVENRATACAAYRADNLPVTEVPFTSRAEAASGGDLPYADAVRALAADADAYWSRTQPSWRSLRLEPYSGLPPDCPAPDASAGGFYCPAADYVAFDNARLGPALYQQLGDNAVGTLIGGLYARAAQERRGATTTGKEGQLAVDCLTGSWTNDLLTRPPGSDLNLSPGDLDEAVAALLAFGRADEAAGVGAFDRIAAYRDGVLKGLKACD